MIAAKDIFAHKGIKAIAHGCWSTKRSRRWDTPPWSRFTLQLLRHLHHIFCDQRIVDVNDQGLNDIIMEHIKAHPVEEFTASSIKLQIVGTFKN